MGSLNSAKKLAMEGTMRCAANHTPLTPISFLERAAAVYATDPAVVFGGDGGRGALVRTWSEMHVRCLRLAAALAALGVVRHDVVAVFAHNIPAMLELHFGIPMAGAVICPLNTHMDATTLSVLLQHSEPKVIFVDHELIQTAQEALRLISNAGDELPTLVLIREPDELSTGTGELEYESLLSNADSGFDIRWPHDECDPIALNYTSGTTSWPKGVVYSHRGAYLNSISAILLTDMTAMPVYLWTVPMYHANGWCLIWGGAAQGGLNICLRKVTAAVIFDCIACHRVTHMGGAPTVLNMIANALATERKPLPGRVTVLTGGAPPPPQVLIKMEELGFRVIHSYGLTETYGAATVCTWKPEWDGLPAEQRARMRARQGLRHLGLQEIDVKDPITMKSVPADERTIGEVMIRGNTVMSGYFKDSGATKEAMSGGWFRSGDLAVRHADGYIQVKDRSEDIIFSGGENISTIEVEAVLFGHPAVLEAAVVGRPDEYWGETPCAFVKLKEGRNATAEDIISFCHARLPHNVAPQTVIFQDLPKTSTGKTQKFVLREQVKAMGSLPRPEMMVEL